MGSLSNPQQVMSQYGTATPYLAIFDEQGMPIMNPLTNIPIGAYVSAFNYKYDEEKENLCTIVIDTGDPDTSDIEALQKGCVIYLQWGYVFADGQHCCGPVKAISVRDNNCVFDSTGTHFTLVCVDGVIALRHLPPHTPVAEEEENDGKSSLADFLNNGLNLGVGVIIEEFK